MGESQQFSLRWNNYVHHITCAFDGLRSDEDLVDVTLSCEGRKIYAHKVMLSACSLYFKDVFKDNPCKHPVIIFRNVKYEDLLAIIDFMYHGEVNVEQEQLSSFLTTAEMLCVQGLSVGSTNTKEDSRKRQPVYMDSSSTLLKQNNLKLSSRSLLQQSEPVSVRTPSPSRKRRLSPLGKATNIAEKRRPVDVTPMKLEADDDIEEDVNDDGSDLREILEARQLPLLREPVSLSPPIKTESELSMEPAGDREEGRDSAKSGQAGTSGTLDATGDTDTDKNRWVCELCGKGFKHKDSRRQHYKTHEGSTACPICNSVLSRKYELKVHMRKKHNIDVLRLATILAEVEGPLPVQTTTS